MIISRLMDYIKYKKNREIEISMPEIIEIEPTNTCNLRCKMCHVGLTKQNKLIALDTNLIDKLDFLKDKWVKIGSNFEPVLHPNFLNIINKLTQFDCKIDLTTNGTLLNKELVNSFIETNIKNITFSFDSIIKETYENIRKNASFKRTIDRILYCREQLSQEKSFIAINVVLCRSNIDEMISMIDFWNINGFDQLRFIFMVIRSLNPQVIRNNHLLDESLYPIREYAFGKLDKAAKHVINNCLQITLSSPYYNWSSICDEYPSNIYENLVKSDNPAARDYFNPGHHYQKKWEPNMPIDCVSPFTFARILYTGDVQLCYRYVIGNLNKMEFKDIWFGKRAQKVRKMILSNKQICDNCEYYKFCLNSKRININDKVNYFSQNLINQSKKIRFPVGTKQNVYIFYTSSRKHNI